MVLLIHIIIATIHSYTVSLAKTLKESRDQSHAKRSHDAVNGSTSELLQQFCKSESITFV